MQINIKPQSDVVDHSRNERKNERERERARKKWMNMLQLNSLEMSNTEWKETTSRPVSNIFD